MDREPLVSTLGWVAFGIAAWLLLATVVGYVIGRMARLRDESVPGPGHEAPPREPGRPGDGASPTPRG